MIRIVSIEIDKTIFDRTSALVSDHNINKFQVEVLAWPTYHDWLTPSRVLDVIEKYRRSGGELKLYAEREVITAPWFSN